MEISTSVSALHSFLLPLPQTLPFLPCFSQDRMTYSSQPQGLCTLHSSPRWTLLLWVFINHLTPSRLPGLWVGHLIRTLSLATLDKITLLLHHYFLPSLCWIFIRALNNTYDILSYIWFFFVSFSSVAQDADETSWYKGFNLMCHGYILTC